MAALTPFLLLLYAVSFLSASVADDGAAILALAKAFRHPPSDWSTTVSTGYCLWTGVRCTSGRVTSISLAAMSLSGGIAPEISTLSELKSVALQRNKLSGNIPSFAKLSSLRELYMDENLFVGVEIGAFAGLTSLRILSLSDNKNMTAWSFPSELVESTSLTTIYLDNTNIFGVLPDIFDSFTSLQNLRLSYNNITGPLPPSLLSLRSLKNISLDNNKFQGPLPLFPPEVKVSVNNNYLCTTKSGHSYSPQVMRLLAVAEGTDSGANGSNSSGGSSVGGANKSLVIVGVIVVVLVILAILGFAVYKFVTKKKYRTDPENPQEIMLINGGGGSGSGGGYANGHGANSWDINLREGRIDTIPMDVLSMATNNFSEDNILGRGGFGVVYSGELDNGTKVAIKRMKMSAMGNKGMKQFQAEVSVLTKVRHRHLVSLLGYCVNENERLLVYEYMPQGNLGHHLFEWRDLGYSPLTWEQRVRIALDMARGVEYLHSFAQQSFIHRDLKPDNILLGNDMRAKVADFGLVKNAIDGKFSDDSKLKGTFGYLAPEYTSTGKSTAKVDVYAVGVVLMEMITGRKALDHTLPEEKSHLATWFNGILTNKDKLLEELDKILKPNEETMESIHRVAELAGHCTAHYPEQRPDMGHVVNWLGSLVETWKQSRQEEESLNVNANMSVPQALHRATCHEEDNFEIDVNMGLDQKIKRLVPQVLQRPSCQEEVIVVNDKFMSGPSTPRRLVPDTDTLSDKHGPDMGQAVNEFDPLVEKCKPSPQEENKSLKIDVNMDLHQALERLSSCQQLNLIIRRQRQIERHQREARRRELTDTDTDTLSNTDTDSVTDKQRPDMGRDVLGPVEKCKQSCQEEEESLEIDENMDVPEDIWRRLHSDTDTDTDTNTDIDTDSDTFSDKQRPDIGRDVLAPLVEKCKPTCQEEEKNLGIDAIHANMGIPEDIWRVLVLGTDTDTDTDSDTFSDKQRPDIGRDVLSPLVEKCKPLCGEEEKNLGIDANMSIPDAVWKLLLSDTDTLSDTFSDAHSDTLSDALSDTLSDPDIHSDKESL